MFAALRVESVNPFFKFGEALAKAAPLIETGSFVADIFRRSRARQSGIKVRNDLSSAISFIDNTGEQGMENLRRIFTAYNLVLSLSQS